ESSDHHHPPVVANCMVGQPPVTFPGTLAGWMGHAEVPGDRTAGDRTSTTEPATASRQGCGLGCRDGNAARSRLGFRALGWVGTDGTRPRAVGPVGHPDEWHLILAKAVQHLPFALAPRLAEEGVVFGPPLPQARLHPVRSVGHPVGRDRLE